MKKAVAFCCLLLAACGGGTGTFDTSPDSAARQRDTAPLAPRLPVNRLAPVDVSPLDISYFPVDFPLRRTSGDPTERPLARVIYSRPHKGGRVIFGGLLKWGEPWRLGANEATELELFQRATVLGQPVPAGRYILYCIPGPNEWVIVFNRNLYSWGLKPDPGQDAFRFNIPVQKQDPPLEHFTMVFQNAPGGASLVIAWDDVLTRLPFTFKS
ncbi:DUF2911 domain-containing protein [Flaviaesturariibacter flavus]|uniref:DUF2911 domain-containing protein n=1 Tax=Flaviaesturariibacter flavus TaxID=2502780 RepID=A0A4R1B9H5_9BACT|nr:DUF2911 domain-containing protein [Flaviaesturariibacter flavus]TCJ13547.1 DUF2911 domain-containing protein [Flaviaesturariibacter flavus]